MRKIILFTLTLFAASITLAQNGHIAPKDVLSYADTMPEPLTNVNQYIADSLVYPVDAIAANVEGRVIVKFIIDENGNVIHPTVLRPVYKSLDSAAIMVISNMPRWKPGMQGGKTVKVYYTLPVVFKLDDPAPKKDSVQIYTHADQMPIPEFNISEYLYKTCITRKRRETQE